MQAQPPAPIVVSLTKRVTAIPGMVSVITPTHRRSQFLRKAERYIQAQDYPHFEWLILDDTPVDEDLSFRPAGQNVYYSWSPTRLTIGDKRNRLIARARGEYIAHFDDDDYYGPAYLSTMVAALHNQQADLINLRSWYLYDHRWDFFGYWKLEQKRGLHYRCGYEGISSIDFTPDWEREFAISHLGWGFSYVYRKRIWDHIKFPNIDWAEDAAFAVEVERRFKMGAIYDDLGLCLHFLHKQSTSNCFPQYRIPENLFSKIFPNLAMN
jgi:glycosyltransferase involved in cell wall biosynthesis